MAVTTQFNLCFKKLFGNVSRGFFINWGRYMFKVYKTINDEFYPTEFHTRKAARHFCYKRCIQYNLTIVHPDGTEELYIPFTAVIE